MPSDFAAVAAELRRAGLSSNTPCLILSAASTGDEQSYLTSLAELPAAPLSLPAPRILIVGDVIKLAREHQGAEQEAVLSDRR
jgi:uroporphyrin-III C-methyltransferase